MKKLITGFCFIASTMLTSLSITANAAQNVEQAKGEKEIQIRRSQNEDLRVSLRALDKGYVTGEKIRFRVSGNDDFYLYMFTISQRTGKAYMILPNRLQDQNKYNGGVAHNVPNANVEFYSNGTGYEKVVYVASRKYLDWNVNGYNKVGDFLETNTKSLDQQIEKQIVLQRRNKPQRQSRNNTRRDDTRSNVSRRYSDDDVFIGEFSFYVGKPGQRYAPSQNNTERYSSSNYNNQSADQPILFLETNGNQFNVGDTVKIVYGADRKGYVHLYSRSEGQRFTRVFSKKVDGQSFYTSRPRASSPTGKQHLVLIYTPERNYNSKDLEASMAKDYDTQISNLDAGLKGFRYSNQRNANIPYTNKTINVR